LLLPVGNAASRPRVLPQCFHGQFSNANSHPKVAAKQLTSNGFVGCGSTPCVLFANYSKVGAVNQKSTQTASFINVIDPIITNFEVYQLDVAA
jgi:hypothetical protein